MFAVPGWSVSVDDLRSETASAANGPSATNPKKRKRNGAAGRDSQVVTPSNVADLYQTLVAGKAGKDDGAREAAVKGASGAGKRPRTENSAAATAGFAASGSASGENADESKGKKEGKGKNGKKKARQPPRGDDGGASSEQCRAKSTAKASSTPSAPDAPAPPLAQASLPPAPTKLTPLQASMREKLTSARFRHLNETLYTKPSEEAFSLFQESPEMFDEYHQGFRRQVRVWPENPVDSFLDDIRSRARAKPPAKGRPAPPPSQRSKMALPRTMGTCIIADLGCGDARLSESLQRDKSKLRLDILSFDLHSPSPLVTKADIAHLPLEDGSVNVAIFCLALMGTNWLDFVEEAYRILHWKGELWIAEIKSRFGPVRRTAAVVEHSVGNRRRSDAALSKKAKAAREAAANAVHSEDLAVEVDGSDDRRRETDVTAFVAALQKRGFVLQGDRSDAVDLTNRMFVKLHFVKGATPTTGKGVKRQEQAPKAGNRMNRFAPKWDEEEEEEADDKADNDETSILKPCVYKIR
ncbi:hypothetical protein UVI_02036980 [Ustilaginoidea virens]|uniref:Ribosomal RNA-processing protein 8 n=1 Tax=Ustilaginoidea virens TaxID=1159556 RepID=A0A1B5L3Z1_USTVR|nr:hypothetical protein UVI_02036980 [Ustilaginoidea virens]